MNILVQAEYLCLFKNPRNAHQINGMLAKIYCFCYLDKLEEAERLLKELDRQIAVEQSLASSSCTPE